MRTTQGQRFFERRMQAFDGNVIVSLAQLDVLLEQNRKFKAQIEELEDKQIEQADTIKFQILDERLCELVIDQERFT